MDSKEGRRKEIIKIGTDINETENKPKTERTKKPKVVYLKRFKKTFGKVDQEKI